MSFYYCLAHHSIHLNPNLHCANLGYLVPYCMKVIVDYVLFDGKHYEFVDHSCRCHHYWNSYPRLTTPEYWYYWFLTCLAVILPCQQTHH